MRLLILLVLILSALNASAFEDLSARESLDLDATWTGALLTSTGADPRISSVEARVTLVPESPFTTDPESELENGTIVFTWDQLENTYEYTISTRTTTRMSDGLRSSVAWPLDTPNTDDETELIDYNDPLVRRFAADIAQGETDALRLAVRVAEAVRNEITYNLSTLNIDATYPASEVLERGEGVCDEITVLYIATMRALGVPARYVSGYAYTNIFDDSGSWEGHGWAEVLIDDTWVPFDLTYGEYVKLAPTHLPIRRSDDAESTTIRYTWYGNDVQLNAQRIETDIEITRRGRELTFGTIDIGFDHERVGPGWNTLEIDVRNELESFIVPRLYVSRTQGLEVENERTLIVPPKTTRTLEVPVLVRESLEPRYEYTFPVTVSARGFETASSSFVATLSAPSYEKPESEDDASESHPDLTFGCTDVLGLPETVVASTCTLTNTGNRNLDLRICSDACVEADVLIGETRTLDVPVRTNDGRIERTVRIIGDVREETTLIATGRSPARVTMDLHGEGATIRIDTTSTHPVNGTITVSLEGYETNATFEDTSITIPSDAFGLSADVTVRATYNDVDGEHTIEAATRVTQSIISYLRTLVERLFR